ncbi:flagellar export protein FliJ [Acutalibacter sp. 1XD8-33]|uniref:flagellar export protein FliJ n=1 Tax=Acutalibacter sp. 1XD8-33 TaxID=2320081 RepID=UPI000EA23A78|nr:flagellar export protein FliJ [Acutalibacter sp. 1XD8-33]RKJ42097.1 flagellar export protein FliJ [Acutalibacter sp. 1XD8-33]
MKKFRFQLDTVLRYKTQILDIRLAEHGTALAQVRKQEGVLEQATRNRVACEEEYRQKKAEGLTIADAMKYETGIEVLERTVRREAEKLRELRKLEEEKRARLVEAKQETQSLEKLKDIKRGEYDAAAAKAEEKEIDDLVMARRSAASREQQSV